MQQRVRARFGRRLGQFDSVSGAVASRAGDHRQTAVQLFRAKGDDPDMLLIGQGGGFPRCAHRDDGVRPILQMENPAAGPVPRN